MYCEKPVTLNTEEAVVLKKAVEESGKTLSVANYRR